MCIHIVYKMYEKSLITNNNVSDICIDKRRGRLGLNLSLSFSPFSEILRVSLLFHKLIVLKLLLHITYIFLYIMQPQNSIFSKFRLWVGISID